MSGPAEYVIGWDLAPVGSGDSFSSCVWHERWSGYVAGNVRCPDRQLVEQIVRRWNAHAAFLEAADACEVWHAAEANSHRGGSTFDERMDLCGWSEYLTTRALSIARGETPSDKFVPVPRIGIGPGMEVLDLSRDVEACRALVARIRAALTSAPGTDVPGMPS